MASPFNIRERVRGRVKSLKSSGASGRSDSEVSIGIEGSKGSIGREEANEPIIEEEVCLMPDQVLVRVEDAPDNSRRIFTGVDIMTSVPVVWAVLNDYATLAEVVPNLVANEVVSVSDDGARLEQVGAAKLGPLTFTAKTVLDVRRFPNGLPPDMEADHLGKEADSAEVRKQGSQQPLIMDVFPRPYAYSSLPHADITMQGVVEDPTNSFSHYQGVWRMQELPGCAPEGGSAMRLTYAVELQPRMWVPVTLLESNIAKALGQNLEAIRNYVTDPENQGSLQAAMDRVGTLPLSIRSDAVANKN